MSTRNCYLAIVLCLVFAGGAHAQPAPTPLPKPVDPKVQVDRAVAKALYDRGKELFVRRDYKHAKMLFVESLMRDASGPSSNNALAMLRTSNERLGLTNLDDGRPSVGSAATTTAGPVDPYGTSPTGPAVTTDTNKPVDPYATGTAGTSGTTTDTPVDPYAAGGSGAGDKPSVGSTPTLGPVDQSRRARRNLKIWSGLAGFTAGLAIGGPQDDSGETRGGAVLAALVGAGAGYAATHYLTRKRDITSAQANAVISGGVWGSFIIGLFGDVVTGVDESTTNDIYRSVAVGSLIGTAGGFVWASKLKPSSSDIAVTNSFGLWGTGAGLLLGVAFDPAESEGYSINGMLGATAGLGVGYLVSRKVEVSNRRMLRVDMFAAAGAAVPWLLLYPVMADDQGNGDEQAVGLISTLTLGGGAYLGWWLTRNMDKKKTTTKLARHITSGMPGLIQRDAAGRWGAGFTVVRPMENPVLAPRTGATSLGIDVLAGRW